MLAKLLGAVGLKGGLGALLKNCCSGWIGSFVKLGCNGRRVRQCFVGCSGICCWCCYWSGINSNTSSWRFIGAILGESLLKKMFGFAKRIYWIEEK